MNPEIKAKWLEALRSGEYKQGKLVLRNDSDQFCCLGVLCDLAEQEGVVSSVHNRGRHAWTYTAANGDPLDRSDALLPRAVIEWAGLSDRSPVAGVDHLTNMNDTGVPFAAIADSIEIHL